MNQILHQLSMRDLTFPPLNQALSDPNGLIAIGGDLSLQRLISAYSSAIFPWYCAGEPIMWWSPDPRAIIPIKDIKINKTLKKVINRNTFHVSINKAFDQVLALCADAPFRQEDTWITDEMQAAYQELHHKGYAHSIEVWQGNELVGGLYGVAINGCFSGESMFYKSSNASKIALVSLASLLKNQNITFIDCQIINPFLQDMGCIELNRDEYISLQQQAKTTLLPDNFWQARSIT
jgi:leucyl/phenylalanyl-tRNA--protein transferase